MNLSTGCLQYIKKHNEDELKKMLQKASSEDGCETAALAQANANCAFINWLIKRDLVQLTITFTIADALVSSIYQTMMVNNDPLMVLTYRQIDRLYRKVLLSI